MLLAQVYYTGLMVQKRFVGIAVLLCILAIASFFRLWELESIPPGLYPDEAVNANTAVQSLETGSFRVFYPENHGREGLYMNLIALSFSVFGISIWSFKIISALAGIITVWGQYLVTKEIFSWLKFRTQAHIIALFSSFFLAISFWHINFSRIGFRGILTPLVLVFSSYFILRGLRTKNILHFIIAGLIYGVGFHTYISFRASVFLFAFAAMWWLLIAIFKKQTTRYLLSWALLTFAVFFIAFPIIIYFLGHPEDFISRAVGVSIFQHSSPLTAFGESLIKHLGMFHFYGDPNWRHNFSGAPVLSLIPGLLFLIGIIFAGKELFNSGKSIFLRKFQTEQSKVFGIYMFLFVWLFALLLPGILTFEGIPHALRTIGAIPPAYIFTALGGYLILSRITGLTNHRKILHLSVPVLLIIFFAGMLVTETWHRYFVAWAGHPKVEEAFTRRFVDVGNYLNSLPESVRVYVIKTEGDLPTEVPLFIQKTAGRSNGVYINKEDLLRIAPESGEVVITMNNDGAALDPLRKLFPGGNLLKFERFWAYEIR